MLSNANSVLGRHSITASLVCQYPRRLFATRNRCASATYSAPLPATGLCGALKPTADGKDVSADASLSVLPQPPMSGLFALDSVSPFYQKSAANTPVASLNLYSWPLRRGRSSGDRDRRNTRTSAQGQPRLELGTNRSARGCHHRHARPRRRAGSGFPSEKAREHWGRARHGKIADRLAGVVCDSHGDIVGRVQAEIDRDLILVSGSPAHKNEKQGCAMPRQSNLRTQSLIDFPGPPIQNRGSTVGLAVRRGLGGERLPKRLVERKKRYAYDDLFVQLARLASAWCRSISDVDDAQWRVSGRSSRLLWHLGDLGWA